MESRAGSRSRYTVALEVSCVSHARKGRNLTQLLVVGGDHATLDSLDQILVDAGWSTRATSDPQTAVQIFKEDSEISVAITSVHVPGMDGFNLIRRLRKCAPHMRDFSAILVTDIVDLNIAMNAIEHRFSAILPTPVSPSLLKLKVSEAWSDVNIAHNPANPSACPCVAKHADDGQSHDSHDGNVMPEGSLSAIARAIARETGNMLLEKISESKNNNESSAYSSENTNSPDEPEISEISHEALINTIKLKEKFFPESLFGDPCWEMLIDLGISHIERRSVSVSSLCIAAGIPQTTALRRISDLEKIGLVRRSKDPEDGRRIYVHLTDVGLNRFYKFLEGFSNQVHPLRG